MEKTEAVRGEILYLLEMMKGSLGRQRDQNKHQLILLISIILPTFQLDALILLHLALMRIRASNQNVGQMISCD